MSQIVRAGIQAVPPGQREAAESLAALVHRIDGPINVIAERGTPAPAELQELGVARMTWGAGLATHAYEEAARIAAEALP